MDVFHGFHSVLPTNSAEDPYEKKNVKLKTAIKETLQSIATIEPNLLEVKPVPACEIIDKIPEAEPVREDKYIFRGFNTVTPPAISLAFRESIKSPKTMNNLVMISSDISDITTENAVICRTWRKDDTHISVELVKFNSRSFTTFRPRNTGTIIKKADKIISNISSPGLSCTLLKKSLDYFPFLRIIVYMYRRQIEPIVKDLNKKIAFIVGPRQVGKTWLALEIGKRFDNTTYLNYDRFEDRQIIKNESWVSSTELLILDELHKMPGWKNYLKGLFDTKPDNLKILVTGSARLDMFRQTGDSLAGRFFIHRLLPFSLSELKDDATNHDIERFIERGGFPEPFLSPDKIDAKRWRNQYIDGLIRTDILDFERVHNFRTIQMVFELLRRRVGAPVSYASIARDVNASPTTIIKYVQVLEALYIIFRVTPYSRNIARSILKEPKIYFFDNGMVVGDDGARFENFVALSLLKHIYGKTDYEGEVFELKYLRTKNKKEIDFCLVHNNQIVETIEAKNRDSVLSRPLKYFCKRYNLKGVQIVKELKRERTVSNIDIINAYSYLIKLIL